jgi:hypothetical protein
VHFTSGTELEVGGGGGAVVPGAFPPIPGASAPSPTGVFQPAQIPPGPAAPASPPSILPPPRSQ